MGLAQWVVLRRVAPQASWWIVATAVGWLAGIMLVATGALLAPGADLFTSIVSGAITGGLVGLAQWFLLRNWVKPALLWIPVNAVAWAVGFTGFLGGTLAGAAIGLITGLALERLFRNANQAAVNI